MLHRIKIKNFRSLDVDVTLAPVTVLIGKSGAGKTNFVDALRFLRNLLQGHQQIENILPLSHKKKALLEYEITFSVDNFHNARFNYTVKFDSSPSPYPVSPFVSPFVVSEEKLTFDDAVLFHKTQGSWIVQPSVTVGPHPDNHSLTLASIKGNQKISIAYVALSTGIGCYDFPSHICRETAEDATRGNVSGLLDSGGNTNTIFDDIKNDLTRLSSWNRINELVRVMNDSIETIDQAERKSGISVTHQFGDLSVPLPIRNESEGLRRFFAHLLAFYQKPPKQIMLFEEPERGIYPAAFAALAAEMKNCYVNGQGQVALTTHSPEMLDLFEPDSIRIVEMKEGVTRIGLIAQDQVEALRENLLYPRELFTVDNARFDTAVCSVVEKEEVCV